MADASPQFRNFWKEYPKIRRGSAYACWKIWKRDKLDRMTEDIMAGLKRYKNSDKWTRDGGSYTDTPTKWLNQKMWIDHPVSTHT